jgi:hypothetical protein
MHRIVSIWTWDAGARPVDMDGEPALLMPILEAILDGGLWRQFEKFPPDVVARLLPRLSVSPATRRFLEIWIEEASRRVA